MLKRLRMLDIFCIRARVPLYILSAILAGLNFNISLTVSMLCVLYLYAPLLSGWTAFVVRFTPLVL